jgi:hypothetical protein
MVSSHLWDTQEWEEEGISTHQLSFRFQWNKERRISLRSMIMFLYILDINL